MFNRKLSVIYALSFALLSMSAFAAEYDLGDKKDGPGKPDAGVSASITWDEFRNRCLHPEQYDVQRAPQNIRIQCADQTTEYVASAPGSVQLAGTRVVATTVLADKFHVAAGAQGIPIAAKGGSCLRFKELEKTITIEKPMSCAEVVGMKGDVSEYCVSALDGAKAGNPKLIDIKETGRVIDTCAGMAQSGDGKDGKDGKGDGKK